jgi:Metal-dependent hydrolases of the beta-lactamase superfamily II
MRVYSLMENTSCAPGFAAEHGLSLYVETQKHKLLFDAGQSGAFAGNAEKLCVDLGTVDTVVLSHGHYDHGDGLKRFFELNDHAPVYMSRYAFGAYYHGRERYIGIDQSLKSCGRLIETQDEWAIDEELSLYSCNGMKTVVPIDSSGQTVKNGDSFVPDTFLHEQYLMIRDKGRKILLSGCSHKGILNIMNWFRPDVLIGGFHFMNLDLSSGKNETLDRTAEILKTYDTEYYTCHCTGAEQYQYLKTAMGEQLHYLASGEIVEL